MKQNITKIFNLVLEVGIAITLVASLFLFTNLTTDFYDTAKFLVLLIFVSLSLILLSVRFILEGSVRFVRTPLDIPLLLLCAVAIISGVMSSSPYVSVLGNQARIFPSVSAIITLVIFYFILTNSLKSISMIKILNIVLIASGAILSVISLIVYFGVKILPSPWIHGINFTPSGTNFSTTAVLAILLPFVLNGILQEQKHFLKVKAFSLKLIYTGVLILFGVTIALTGVNATWIAAILVSAIVLFFNRESLAVNTTTVLIGATAGIILVVSILSYLPIPNVLRTQAQNFPREVQLSLQDSWKVSVSAFRDSPFWGSGAATYLFDFTNYKPVEFNSSKNWTLRFDTPINEYLLMLATLGGVGLITLLSLTVMFITTAYKLILINQKLYGLSKPQSALVTSTALSGLAFFIIIMLHPATFVLWVVGLFILASFVSISLLEGYSVRHQVTGEYGNSIKGMFIKVASNISTTNSVEENIKFEALPSILLTVSIAIALVAFYFGGKLTLADYYHRLALNAAGQNNPLDEAYNQLVNAEKLNPYSDLYRTDIAQTNFVLANAIASAKGPTESSPSGSLTDQDKTNIQTLLQQSVNEARTAVTLSPKSAINWEILALLYRQISGVAQNALVFSLDSYGRAIQQDPLNPALRLSVGGVYYAVQSFDQAVRFFTDAINLKPDYANAYYNLSVALRDKGDLTNAQAAAEEVLKLVDANSNDYKVANDYLTDLKTRIASGSAQGKQNEIVPPAAEQTKALEKKELPKVVNVGNPPEKIATPAAIKKSPTPSASPKASTTPSPTPEATVKP